MADLHALPTEPLLDDPTRGVERWRTLPEIRRWIVELAEEGDVHSRCGLLFHSLRKQLATPMFLSMGRGILAGAVRGEAESIAALSGFLAVDAPGEMLIERVREFSNLHREADNFRRQLDAGNQIGKAEHAVLSTLSDLDLELAARWPEPPANASVRDRGPAWRCRQAFGGVVAELEATGTLDPDSIQRLLRLARLEFDALELRASHLAGSINPYSVRQVSQVMPILGSVDEELRDMRRFLGQLEESNKAALFHQQAPSLSNHLDGGDEQHLRDRLSQEPELQVLWRLMRGLDRNPIPQRTLAWFVDRVLDMGEVLTAAGVRANEIDVASAVLCVLDHQRDGILQLPASVAVMRALDASDLDGVDVVEGSIRVVLDPSSARRLSLPYGFPVPARADADEEPSEEKAQEETVKDLVMANINNVSVLLGLLKNQKVINTPGVVAMVVLRGRNMRVLDTICTARNLHSGFANKDVPLTLLNSPMNIPIKVLRKFINVRYVSRVDLHRLAKDRSAVRREVGDQVLAYLKSLS